MTRAHRPLDGPVREARDALPRPLRVQLSLERPDGTTRFVNQVTAALPPDIQPLYFSWPRALLGRYDVFHLHWPDALMRTKGPTNLLTHLLYAVLLMRWWVMRTPVVWTMHNLAPHERATRGERWLFTATERLTTAFVRLNLETPFPGVRDGNRTILHGHYRDRFAELAKAPRSDNTLLFFGLVRPYKGVDVLLDTFGTLPEQWRLRIVGAPVDAELSARVRRESEVEPRLSANLSFVPDDELVREVSAAEVVILPYEQLHNSGVLLVALSLDRPVIVPDTPTTAALAAEVGEQWVIRLSGRLDARTLRDAITALGERRHEREQRGPAMSERDWASVGRKHAELYRDLASRAAARRAPGP